MFGRNFWSYGLIILGTIIILGSVGQLWWQDIWYWWNQQRNVVYSVETSGSAKPDVQVIVPKSKEYGLVIEKIKVNEVVAPDVDPFDSSEYMPILQKFGVAAAKGGANPGEVGTTYLFGHSTINVWEIGLFHAPFTLLDKLEIGDRLVVFYQGKQFNYFVSEMKSVRPTEVNYLTDVRQEPTLILQTCDPPGQNTKRLLVIAKLDAGLNL